MLLHSPDPFSLFAFNRRGWPARLVQYNMATIGEREALLTKRGDVETGVVKEKVVHVQSVGRETTLSGYLYGDTNFYIRSSAQYFRDRKLTTYIYFYYMQYVYLVVFIVSCLSPLSFILALIMTAINILFLVFYSQHLYVNIKTMVPCVLKQPTLPDRNMTTNNDHLEITAAEFSLTYAQYREHGIGVLSADGGTVQIQVFRERAMQKMRLCVVLSTVSFFVCVAMLIYCNLSAVILIHQSRT